MNELLRDLINIGKVESFHRQYDGGDRNRRET